jgi:hypothetical protein
LSLDKWTSSRTKKYINVTFHGDPTEEPYNLGLARIFGSCTATNLLEAVHNNLASSGVNYKQHIVGSAGDGASAMVKFGKECPTFHQSCLNHGVQLGVCDTLHKTIIKHRKKEQVIDADAEDEDFFGDMTDIEMTPTGEEVIEKAVEIHEIIGIVRKVVKYFRFSSVKNGVLQGKNQIRPGPQP